MAARRFVRDGLGPGRHVAVYTASEGMTLDLTADPDTLAAAIAKLRAHPRISENGLQSCPRMTPYQAYLIDNNLDYAAFNAALDELQHCQYTDPNDAKTHGSAPPDQPDRTLTAPRSARKPLPHGSRLAGIR